jgi:chromosome segregation ATPase
MESLNKSVDKPVEQLNLLEQKLAHLIDILNTLRQENKSLNKENIELKERVEQLEHSMLKGTKDMEELNQEREMTKMVVDDLIKSIDTLVEKSECLAACQVDASESGNTCSEDGTCSDKVEKESDVHAMQDDHGHTEHSL